MPVLYDLSSSKDYRTLLGVGYYLLVIAFKRFFNLKGFFY